MFSVYDVCLNHGEVRGDVFSFNEQGKIVGDMAVRTLSGENPQDIPAASDTNADMFDGRVLRCWGRSAGLIEIRGELCVMSMITNITDRKRAEAMLLESE